MRAAAPFLGLCLVLAAGISCGESPSSSSPSAATAVVAVAAGDGQEGAAGDAFPAAFSVRVSDSAGRALRGIPVDFIPQDGAVATARVVTDAQGVAATHWTAPIHTGRYALTASAGGRSSATLYGLVKAAAPVQLGKAVADTPRAGAGETVRLAVRIADRYDNPVPGIVVSWQAQNGGSLPSSSVTDSSGVAAAGWTLPPTVGWNGASAAVQGLGSVGFSALGRPRLARMEPALFRSGDTVRVHGGGLAAVALALAGHPVAEVSASDSVLAFVAPASLPACAAPLPRISLRLAHPLATLDTMITTFGRPLDAPGTVGAHAVLPLASAGGCPVRLTPGTYGVAVYRVVTGPQTSDTVARAVTLQVDAPGQAAAAASPRVVASGAGSGLARLLQDGVASDVTFPVHPAAARAGAAACRAPAAVGDTVSLVVPPRSQVAGYTVAASSAHFNWLFTAADLDSLTAFGRQRLAAVVDSTEAALYPFLIRNFGVLPDYDGDGRLNIVSYHEATASGRWTGWQVYANGCLGDFVFITWDAQFSRLNDPAVSLPYIVRRGIPAIVAHEAIHWIDFSNAVPTDRPRDWTVEAFPNIPMIAYVYEATGGSIWDARDFSGLVRFSSAPGDATYAVCLPQYVRYGYLLWSDGAYNAGCAMIYYLLNQARLVGDPGPPHLRALLGRRNHGTLAGLWTLVASTPRSELELEGEFLLAFYADHVIPGASDRLSLLLYNLHDPSFPARLFAPASTVQATQARSVVFPLSVPDGSVVELVVPSGGATLSLPDSGPEVGLAIVRRY